METTTPNYAVDYEDKRLTNIKSEEQTQLEQNAQMYDGMIQGVDEQYKGIADTIQSNADKLAQTQQENTDFQVQKIDQQKQQAQKDYTKEQSGAYVDFQKQSNQYGVNAEQMAMQGLAGSGYSESSKVAMYNQYQNRVAVARETLSKVIMNYDNNIQQAILQNNSTIAQIQSEASLKQAEILLEGFNQKNTLLQQQAEREMQLKSFYQNKWQAELDQINKENALAEEVRQAQIRQEQWKEEQRIAQERWQKEYDLAKDEADRQADLQERQMKIKEAEEKRNAEAYSIAKQSDGIVVDVPGNTNGKDGNLNSAETTKKSDYYVKGKTQPMYYNDSKLSKSKVTVGDVAKLSTLTQAGIKKTQNIWQNDKGNYVVYDNNGNYIDVTKYMTFSNGYQPKYVNGKKLNAVITISEWRGSASAKKQMGVPKSQNIWKAGNQFYVWDGKRKMYKDVTNIISNASK